MKRILYLFLFPLFFKSAFAQSVLRGKVISKETNAPLPSISVYINNTSIGTITNEKGEFVISKVPGGTFRLIISSVGFDTYVQDVDHRDISKEFIILLRTKSQELEGFVVAPPEPDGWKKYGTLFTDIFIGTVPTRANNCKLMNPEVIKFRLNSRTNMLNAFSEEPLVIMNFALGYEIRYKLEEFEYDYNTQLINYSGYALFSDLGIAHPNRAKRYAVERLETYRGSLMHFMRSFFLNDLEVQGFEMRSLGNILNTEKERAKLKFSQNHDSTIKNVAENKIGYEINTTGVITNLRSTTVVVDSTDYFKKKLLEPDSVISHQMITSDSVGFAADSSIAGLYFQDSLEVSYTLKEIPARYRALSKSHKNENFPVSQFVFTNKRPVFVLLSGYYYKPYDLKITGYWAWSECMSTRLPFDYHP